MRKIKQNFAEIGANFAEKNGIFLVVSGTFFCRKKQFTGRI
jgi:hypothetical protein